jgi:hypothetical protein
VIELRKLTSEPDPGPKKKAEFATAISKLLAPIRDPLVLREYGRRAAEMLRVSEKEFLSRFKDLKTWKGLEPEISSGGTSVVRSLEEQVLERLLHRDETVQVPPLEALPAGEVFVDPGCRNIYRAFYALYAEVGAPPDFSNVRSRLGEDEGTVARLAKIVLETEITSGGIGLLESLDKLVDRWRRQRIKELQGEISEAQRKGDDALRDRLANEKTSLSRSLHRGSRQGANHGLG